MKKNLALLTAALMLSTLASCSSNGTGNPSSSAGSGSSAASSGQTGTASNAAGGSANANFNATGLPILNEPETYSIAVATNVNQTNTFPEKQAVIDAEAATNIHIEWREIPDTSWSEKINLMFTSGDLTDAVWGDVSVANYSEFLVPLGDYIDEYGPYMLDIFEEYPSYKKAVTSPEGVIYGLPRDRPVPWGSIAELPFINQSWLDTLELEMPTSLEELKEVLMAFKTRDPNKNGQADEIPLSFQQGWGTKIDSLFGWFGIPENDTHIRIENDVAIFIPGEQAYYEALVYFNDLYKAGLLDKEGFSHTAEQYTATARSEPGVYGVMIQSFVHHIAGNNSGQYAVLPPFEGTVWNVTSETKSANPSVFVTTACEYPEVMMRYFDYCNSDMEIAITWIEGPRGVGYEMMEDGQWYPILNETAPEGMTGNQWRYTVGTGGRCASFQYPHTRYLAENDDARIRLNNQELYLACAPEQFYPSGLCTPENETKRQSLATDIDSYIQNFKSNSIINGIDEAKWQAHLDTLKSLQTEAYTEAWQEYYDMKK